MTTVSSHPQPVAHPQATVYAALSNLANAASHASQLEGLMPGSLSFAPDSITANVPPVGNITLTIAERQEPSAIKYVAQQAPVPLSLWANIEPQGNDSCQLTLTAEADLNPMLATMVRKPLADALERMAEAIAQLPFNKI